MDGGALTRLPHDALADLAALYALDLLADAEVTDFEAHLASCAECRGEVREYRETASALAFAARSLDADTVLRTRVVDAALTARSGSRGTIRK